MLGGGDFCWHCTLDESRIAEIDDGEKGSCGPDSSPSFLSAMKPKVRSTVIDSNDLL